tara:strand:+ start:1229 stop:1468 length:240 start_codon:yes stop_codon:yes gene_type:complete
LNLVKGINDMTVSNDRDYTGYFQRNPLAYALALEGANKNLKQIETALTNSGWYSKDLVQETMKEFSRWWSDAEIKESIQ